MPRLDVLLAHNLGYSRKQVTRLFRAGRICDAQGERLDDPRLPCRPSDGPKAVQVDGQGHVLHHRISVVQHKPCGVVTALRDRHHDTAYGLLGDLPLRRHLRAIGRLDKDTSGLLLWTTDGVLLHKLTHPRWAVPRTYHAALALDFIRPPPAFELDDGHCPRIADLRPLERAATHPGLTIPDAAKTFATITVTTGKFHEVRRIFAALGSEVLGLCRVAFGAVALSAEQEPGSAVPQDLHRLFADLHPIE